MKIRQVLLTMGVAGRARLEWERGLPILAAGLTSGVCHAQDVERNLAQELTNPIASLYTLPLQLNFDRNLGPGGDGYHYQLNAQPLIPFALNEDWQGIGN
jgi:hypothetical protein